MLQSVGVQLIMDNINFKGIAMRNYFTKSPQHLCKKVIPFEIKQIDDSDPDFFFFEGLASTFGNVDRDGDIIKQGAFDIAEIRSESPPLLWVHDMSEPIGIFISFEVTPEGLFVKGKLPKSDDLVRGRVIPQMKIGSLKAMSIGFSIIDQIMEAGRRIIEKLKLWEISLVPIPANPLAVVTGMKTATTFQDLPLASREMSWDSDAADGRVREFTGSTESPNASYKDAFFWYDRENAEEFGSYKLPFVDIVDGRMVAVPRGIFAAAGALQGARGGVNIPDTDRPAVINHVESYYKKMGLESPFTKSFDVEYIKGVFGPIDSIRKMEEVLRSVGFTRKGAEFIVESTKNWEQEQRDVDLGGQRDVDFTKALEVVNNINSQLTGK